MKERMCNPVRYCDVKGAKCMYAGSLVAYSCRVKSELATGNTMRRVVDSSLLSRNIFPVEMWCCADSRRLCFLDDAGIDLLDYTSKDSDGGAGHYINHSI